MNPNDSAGFHWTGHPFIDFGIATLMAWCGLTRPEDKPEMLTIRMVSEFAKEVLPAYFSSSDLSSSLSISFLNLKNPGKSVTREKNEASIKEFLEGFLRPPDLNLPLCPFFGTPSVGLVTRKSFPLLIADEQINFYPHGQIGLPVSGQAMTAMQAVIFGSLRAQGKLMLLATDDKQLLRDIVRMWVSFIKRRIQLSELGDIAPPKTALVGTLVALQQSQLEMLESEVDEEDQTKYYGGATLYHFSNSGQGPSIDLYPLPAYILTFIEEAQAAGDYEKAWNEIRHRSWRKSGIKGNRKYSQKLAEPEPTSSVNTKLNNVFYEDLFSLPNGISGFVYRYFYLTMRSLVENHSANSVSRDELIFSLWSLTEFFLKEVCQLDAERIGAIKQLADRMAEVCKDEPRRFSVLWKVGSGKDWRDVRRELLRLDYRVVAKSVTPQEPLLKFESFLSIFEIGEETGFKDWRLAWDLVKIRLLEHLYEIEPNFFKEVPEVTQALDKEEAQEDDTQQEDY